MEEITVRKVKNFLSEEEISALPSWVKADIDNAVFVGDSKFSAFNAFSCVSGIKWL